MAICTVVGIARCVPGHEQDVARAANERLKQRSAMSPGRLDAFLFEDRTDPSLFIYVGRWESQAAFQLAFRQYGMMGDAAWYAERPTVSVYTRVLAYAQALAPAEMATITLVDGSPETGGALREYLVSRRRTMNLREYGMVEHEIGQDVNEPGHFSVFVRWRTVKDIDAGRARLRTWFDPEIAALGATIRRYDGRLRAETRP